MPAEADGFPSEPTYPLAELAGREQLQERVCDLENERAALVREALLSLAAEFEDLAALTGTLAPTYLLGMADAARMARERAGVDVGSPGHVSAGHDKPEHVNGVPGAAQGAADGAP